ncbi:hypothetical protein PMIN05_000846 [Paraphaeosphaeria minitans]
MGNGGLLVEITGALFRGCYVPSVLSRSQTPDQKASSLEVGCGIYGLTTIMTDPGFMHDLVAERLGTESRDKLYQLQCFGDRIHGQSLRLPDAVLEFYVNHSHRVPSALQIIDIDELNLTLSQFVGDDPLLAMSELETTDIEGLKRFCKLFCYVHQPALEQPFPITLKNSQKPVASSGTHQTPSTPGTEICSQLPSTTTHQSMAPAIPQGPRPVHKNGSPSTGFETASTWTMARRESPPSAIYRGGRRHGVMNPSMYGASCNFNLGLCYYVFGTSKKCPAGKNCTNRHQWFSLSEVRWIRSIAAKAQWEGIRDFWALPEPPVCTTRFVE